MPDETSQSLETLEATTLEAHSETTHRQSFGACDIVHEVWTHLALPNTALSTLSLTGSHSNPAVPSSFKIGILAQSSIALSALSAALLYATRNRNLAIPTVHVPLHAAVVEFKSERLYEIEGEPKLPGWGALGGLHKTKDGHVRIHDSFPNHARGTLELLGLPVDATREDVAEKVATWNSLDLEKAGTVEGKLAIYALRSYEEWDALPQATAVDSMPIRLRQLAPGPPRAMPNTNSNKCLQGIRVLELSRVIAAPLAGRTLAAHGADVLWVTSPTLPDLPAIDRDLGRGKRTVQLDICDAADKKRLLELVKTCDVFIQGFRPNSLSSHGLSPDDLAKLNPNIIYANMSAFGPNGPWSQRRGFDSLVQTCSGMNVSEAEHAGKGEAARALPCQALDHSAGYMLATGINAALYHRATSGGAWQVDVSLAGMMKYLRSLGQFPDATGFGCKDIQEMEDVPEEMYETRDTGFGRMKAVKHCAVVEGCEVGWEVMPKPLGSDHAEWL